MNERIISLSIPVAALMALTSCSAPGGGANDKMMADHMAMMKADSAANATVAAAKECFSKVSAMFGTGNTEGIEGCVAESFVDHQPTPGITTTGIQGLKDAIAMHHGAFPDTKMTVISSTMDGDLMYVHFNMKATNTGAMGPDMPATGKAMDMNGVDILRFENGKAVEHWGYWEEMKMMQQLGMMPSPGEAPKMDEKKKK